MVTIEKFLRVLLLRELRDVIRDDLIVLLSFFGNRDYQSIELLVKLI